MMKTNKLLESIRATTPSDIKREIDLSFYVANRICDILREKGMTQKDLALLLNKRESEVSKWLRGTHNFTLKSIAKIEDVLGACIFEIDQRKSINNKWASASTTDSFYTASIVAESQATYQVLNEGNTHNFGTYQIFAK